MIRRMPSPGPVLFVLWGGVIGVWVGLLAAQFFIRRRGLILTPRAAGESGPGGEARAWPGVCVVIPCRNEAAEIAACLDLVLRQDYPQLRVVVVNDRSEDDTAAIAARYARNDSRVRVETVDELPDGWMGKSHALWRATRDASAEWLLFLDADCRLDPSAVTTAVCEALGRGVGLLSLWPRQAPGTFWEHMTIPLCAGIVALWFGSLRLNPLRGQRAFANGQFLLIRRDAYERIGGHQAVRDAIIEDIPLAERATSAGVTCLVASGRDLVSVRMYREYAAIRDGWARIYVGALRSSWKIAASILWLLFGSLLPYLVAVLLLAGGIAARTTGGGTPGMTRPVAAAFCATHLLLLYVVSWRFWGLGDCPRRHLWLYPVSVVVVIRILAKAWWWLSVRRVVPWRNTDYTIDRRARIVSQSGRRGPRST